VTAYCGCVGDDDSAATLRVENEKAGVKSVYTVNTGGKTGSCAVLLTKSAKGEPVRYVPLIHTHIWHNHPICRCLLTDLQSAEEFSPDYLKTPETDSILDSATHIYIEGFFLTHGVESATYVAKKASEAGKVRLLYPSPSPHHILTSSCITH
jgi:adenosine kinase